MEVEVPLWLNREFAEGIFRKSENDDTIRVTKIAVKAATNKGDNYTSDMFRLNLEITRGMNSRETTKKMSVLVKVAPTEEGARPQMVEDARLFLTEISMMKDTLRKMNKLLGPNDRISSDCIFTRIETPALLVMEDLAPLGFRMANRERGLDLEHCLLTMRGLAKYHASSVALCEVEPKHKSMYTRGMFSAEHPKEMAEFFGFSIKNFAEKLANWLDVDSKYSQKLLRFSEDAYMKGAEAATTLEDDFNVITHGDCWVNNMLFRYDDSGKVTGHIFVDFQIASWGTPALDLQYFINTSPSDEVEINHRDLLLEEYTKTLSTMMTRLGCKTAVPSLEKIKAAMKRVAVCGMLSAFTIFPVIVADKNEIKTMNELMEDKSSPAIENEYFRKVITRRLPEYDAQGLLDL